MLDPFGGGNGGAREERRLTVSTLCESRAPRYTGGPAAQRLVPFLRMRGAWLEAAGFHRGERVRVEVEPGRLVLTPLESADQDDAR